MLISISTLLSIVVAIANGIVAMITIGLAGCLIIVDVIITLFFVVTFAMLGMFEASLFCLGFLGAPFWIFLLLKVISNNGTPQRISSNDSQNIPKAERRDIPCNFDGKISYEQFRSIALKTSRRIRRLSVEVYGSTIYGEVTSQSGISTWEFTIDFNDYGNITGNWWITRCENDDSYIPNRYGELMEKEIEQIIDYDS